MKPTVRAVLLKYFFLLFLISVAFTYFSCTYEDGPMLSFRSAKRRLVNHWKYDVVTRNGFEVTHQYKGQSIDLKESGDATFHFIDSTLTGKWSLSDDRTGLLISLSLSNGKTVILDYTITRLKKNEMTLAEYVNYVEIKYYMKPLD